ncbi:MAG: glutamate synthase central domain-containing protein [Candidatus Competibacteraceae bacterium]|nr:glutamate synthase central domain-containing protein [Candidatus Competibacteraceae bacterium]
MLLIDLEQGRIIDDAEIKAQLAAAQPYQDWLDATQIRLQDLPTEVGPMAPDPQTLLRRQQAFGYTQEDVRAFLDPMAASGEDPIGSMGTRHAARRCCRTGPSCSTTTSSRTSPRSPTRRSTRSAKSW